MLYWDMFAIFKFYSTVGGHKVESPQKTLQRQLQGFQNMSGCQNRLKIVKILKGVISEHLKKRPV